MCRRGQLSVGELLIHRPHDHVDNATEMNNISVVDALIALAGEIGVPTIEPFTGLQRFAGQLTVLGPTREFYDELLVEQLGEEQSGGCNARLLLTKLFDQKLVVELARRSEDRELPSEALQAGERLDSWDPNLFGERDERIDNRDVVHLRCVVDVIMRPMDQQLAHRELPSAAHSMIDANPLMWSWSGWVEIIKSMCEVSY